MKLRKQQVLTTLEKFRNVDKYQTFREILPDVIFTDVRERETVSEILDNCCADLIQLLRGPQPATKPVLKKVLILCMDELAVARINTTNREFGYQLGWFLAEKVAIDLKKGTEKKVWGYWQVQAGEVKPPIRPRFSKRHKAPQQHEESAKVPDNENLQSRAG